MSHAEVKNIAHSVNVRLKNLAVQKQISFDYILLRYALERFFFPPECIATRKPFYSQRSKCFCCMDGTGFPRNP